MRGNEGSIYPAVDSSMTMMIMTMMIMTVVIMTMIMMTMVMMSMTYPLAALSTRTGLAIGFTSFAFGLPADILQFVSLAGGFSGGRSTPRKTFSLPNVSI